MNAASNESLIVAQLTRIRGLRTDRGGKPNQPGTLIYKSATVMTYILSFILPYDFYFRIINFESESKVCSFVENERLALIKQGHKECRVKYYEFCSFRLEDYPCRHELVLGNAF